MRLGLRGGEVAGAGRRQLAAAAALAVLSVAGCGTGSGTQVTLTEYRFDPSDIQVSAGAVTLTLVNAGATSHDMVVTDSTGTVIARSPVVHPGQSAVFRIAHLPAGRYAVYCDLPGHRESGMEATLTAT